MWPVSGSAWTRALEKWMIFTAGPTGPAMGAVGWLLFFMGALLREMQHSAGMRVAIKSI